MLQKHKKNKSLEDLSLRLCLIQARHIRMTRPALFLLFCFISLFFCQQYNHQLKTKPITVLVHLSTLSIFPTLSVALSSKNPLSTEAGRCSFYANITPQEEMVHSGAVFGCSLMHSRKTFLCKITVKLELHLTRIH